MTQRQGAAEARTLKRDTGPPLGWENGPAISSHGKESRNVSFYQHTLTLTSTWVASATGLYRAHPEFGRLVREGVARSGGTVKRPRLSLAEAGGA
jgi:hypothetical protein